MNPTNLLRAIIKAEEFIHRANQAKKKIEENGGVLITGCKETAACRRASMDLTRILAQVRKSG